MLNYYTTGFPVRATPQSRSCAALHSVPTVHLKRARGSASTAKSAPLELLSLPTQAPHTISARGFLAEKDPLARLPAQFDIWERALDALPQITVAAGDGKLRSMLAGLPPFPVELLLEGHGDFQVYGQNPTHTSVDVQDKLWRAYLVLSFLSHAYVWCEDGSEPPPYLPASLAGPWVRVAELLDMPPVLVYATYVLHNWRRLDPAGPVELGNVVSLQNFLGGLDEEWFRLVHLEIEAKGGKAIAVLPAMQQAVLEGDESSVTQHLETVAQAISDMLASLMRMDEKCDPDIYFRRVRVPLAGWRGNPKLPEGLLYAGTEGPPQQLFGCSGAQSSIVPAIEAALGIQHDDGRLKDYLRTMRKYMPPAHRQVIADLEAGPNPRDMAGRSGMVGAAYNQAVHQLETFRSVHMSYAHRYIVRHAADAKGTGGLTVMPDLTTYRDTTRAHTIK